MSHEKGSLQTVRASAALEAAGAFDTPVAVPLDPLTEIVTLYVKYTRGGASGAFKFRVKESPDGVTFYRQCLADGSTLTTSAPYKSIDVGCTVYEVEAPASGSAEYYAIPVNVHAAKAVQVEFAEYGNTGAPGTLEAYLQAGAS